MQLSRRHHYIPQFLINGFTGDENKVAVYDIKEKRFWKTNASSKQIFFEWNRNIFEINNEETDFVEKLYKNIDNDFAEIYNEIKNQKEPQLDILQWFHLILFIGITYWRIPKTDNEIKSYINNSTRKDLFFEIRNKETNQDAPKEIYNRILREDSFIESYRMIKPLFDWIKKDPSKEIENWKLYYAANSNELHLLGDNPIILRDDCVENIFNNELIFPLTKGKKVYHTKGKKIKKIPPENSVKIDILIMLQSTRYICGPDRNYLNAIVMLSQRYNTEERKLKLKEEVFEVFN